MDLPFVDEHAVVVAAEPQGVWDALADALPHAFGGRGAGAFARAIGCEPASPSGAFPEPGAAVVGFRVARAAAPRELALEGAHRFSHYSLAFHVDALPGGRTRLRAVTHAAFPGVAGAVYRAAVIGTRGHMLLTRRILGGVKRRAEGAA